MSAAQPWPLDHALAACRGRDGFFDFVTGLRGLAALYVVLSHTWYHIWPAVPWPYGYGIAPQGLVAWLTGWLYYSHFAVVVFIVLSGFCLMHQALRHGAHPPGGTAGFLRRRAERVLPPYYAALLLSLALVALFIGQRTGTQWDISVPVTPQGVLAHVFLLQDVVGVTEINFVFWSIAFEVHLYLLFPGLLRAWRRFGGVATVLGVCVPVYVVIAVLEAVGFDALPPQFLALGAYFALGMGAAGLLRSPPRARAWPWGRAAAALALGVAGLCLHWGHAVAEQRFALLGTLCALATACLLLHLAQADPARSALRRLLGARAALALGMCSYSLYLVHAPLLQLVWLHAVRPLGLEATGQFIALLLCGLPCILAVAWAFFRLVERPCVLGLTHRARKDWAGYVPALRTRSE